MHGHGVNRGLTGSQGIQQASSLSFVLSTAKTLKIFSPRQLTLTKDLLWMLIIRLT